MLAADRDSLAGFTAYHRERLGLTWNQLASRTTTRSSADIRDIEIGLITQLRPRSALALAAALELDDHDTDRFLFLAGCAPRIDWQQLALDTLDEHGLGSVLRERAEARYAALRPRSPRRRDP